MGLGSMNEIFAKVLQFKKGEERNQGEKVSEDSLTCTWGMIKNLREMKMLNQDNVKQ